ncbi:hypothetical protein [Prescottella equi]|uniref:hypothetical protein n=1 Tax=Rhodococcus hoagii TaxID=43767 RepID=UPI001C754DD9|nr:hypothetical protein [Prescottella equi]BCN45259.1 hypothetical protein RE9414_35390 [Prescottella equi]
MDAKSNADRCKHGHLLTAQEPYRDRNGYLRCRECQADYTRRYRLKQRAAAAVVKAFQDAGVGIDLDTLTLTNDPATTDLDKVAARLVKIHGGTVE